MARIMPGPRDVEQARLSVPSAVTNIARSRAGESLIEISDKVGGIINAARTQQIENQVVDAELNVRRDLDQLRVELDKDPNNDTLVTRWAERSAEIVEAGASRLTSPAHQRLWRERSLRTLETERRGIETLQRARTVDIAEAGLIARIADAQAVMTSEDSSPTARTQAMTIIEEAVSQAVARRTLTAAEGASRMASVRAAQTAFEQGQGLIAQSTIQAQEIIDASGSMAEALERIRELPPGELRDRTQTRALQHYALERTIEAEARQAEAQNAADTLGAVRIAIDEGREPTDAQRRVLVRAGTWAIVDNEIAVNAGGGDDVRLTPAASNTARNRIGSLQRDNPAGFAALDLNEPLSSAEAATLGLRAGLSISAQLQPDDYNAVFDAQGRGSTDDTTLYNALRSRGDVIANAAGFDVSDGQDNDARRAAFHGALLEIATQFVESNDGRPMTDAQEREAVTLALRQVSRGNTDWLSGDARPGRTLDASVGGLAYADIPQFERDRLLLMYHRETAPTRTRHQIRRDANLPEELTDAQEIIVVERMYAREHSE